MEAFLRPGVLTAALRSASDNTNTSLYVVVGVFGCRLQLQLRSFELCRIVLATLTLGDGRPTFWAKLSAKNAITAKALPGLVGGFRLCLFASGLLRYHGNNGLSARLQSFSGGCSSRIYG